MSRGNELYTVTTWAHLPNAAHIDTVLIDVVVRPEVWGAAWDEATSDSDSRMILFDALNAMSRVAHSTLNVVGLYHVQPTLELAARNAVTAAFQSLVAWPESSALLDLTPDALRTIISTCDGAVKYQAALLLPAVIARSTP